MIPLSQAMEKRANSGIPILPNNCLILPNRIAAAVHGGKSQLS
jgi:hypothetical protein